MPHQVRAQISDEFVQHFAITWVVEELLLLPSNNKQTDFPPTLFLAVESMRPGDQCLLFVFCEVRGDIFLVRAEVQESFWCMARSARVLENGAQSSRCPVSALFPFACVV